MSHRVHHGTLMAWLQRAAQKKALSRVNLFVASLCQIKDTGALPAENSVARAEVLQPSASVSGA
jgi:hypothetical protein